MSSIFFLIVLAYPNQFFHIPSRGGNKLLGICRAYCNNYLLCEKSKIAISKMEQTFCVGDALVKPWQFKGSILFAAIVRYSLNHSKENQIPLLGWSL